MAMDNVSKTINEMQIRLRDDGRYEGRLPTKYSGKSIYGRTKAEVKNKAKEFLQKIENGYREPKKITLNNYIEYWLKNYKYGNIEPPSYTRLVRVYENQIKDTIGKKMIGDIKREDVQNLINLYAYSSKDKLLSKSGLKKVIQLLNACFKVAVKEKILFENVCEDVIIPSESYIKKKTKKQFSLSDADMDQFRIAALRETKNGEYYSRNALVLLLILNLGFRAGEILCLEWSDVDFDNEVVHVNKTLQCGIRDFEDQYETVMYSRISDSPKTQSGIRYLKMNENVLFYFKELKAYDERNGVKSKYVCHTRDGRMSNHRNLQKCLDRIISETDVEEKVTLHTLRHTFGSVLIRRGVRVEVVSKLMGHANISITYNKYIHTIREEEVKALSETIVC